MKKILIVLLVVFGFYSCGNEPTSIIQEEKIIDFTLIKNYGFTRNPDDTLEIKQDKIVFKYGLFTRKEIYLFTTIIDSNQSLRKYLVSIVNELKIKESTTYTSQIADSHRYIYNFRTSNQNIIIDYNKSSNIPENIQKLVDLTDSLITEYKLKYPLE